MMQAIELGDKRTADKIESLIRNFHPDSPVPISVYVPSSEDDFIPNISPPSSSDSDSPVMLRSSKPAWNPPENVIAIYGAMLNCGVTLPLQPFIARFLMEARIAPAQLAPNSYRILMCLGLMWKLKGYEPPTPREIHHFYTLRQAVCDFDTVCDLQARAVKNSEAASKRHAAGLSKEGIASPDGGDPSDGEEAGDISEGGVDSGQPPVHTEATANTPAATTPSHKGKEKVGISGGGGGVNDIPIFDADVPETPLDPASDLAPRASRGKRPAEGTPDHAARLPGLCRANAAVPSSEEVNELHVPASTPPQTASPSRVASSLVAMGEPNVSSGHPQPSGRSESVDRPGPSKQPGGSASGSGVAHKAPHVGSNEADEGTVSLSDFSAIEICSHLINNDVYIGEGWEHVKGKPCNRKMEFFFNCHSLASVLATEKLSTEESYAQHLTHLRESADGHLSAQIAAKEKLSTAEEEVRSLKEQLSASQESLAARLEAERLAEEAKEKVECEALDLRNQLSSRELIFDNLKAVLEAESVDRFKRSPAYDALLLREFERGMRQSKKFFAMKDHLNEKALRCFDRSLQQHMASGVGSIKEQIKRWKAHCRYNRTEPHPMHLEIPSKRAFNTYYSGQKGSFSGSGAEPDLGHIAGRDYEPFMPDGDKEITWPFEEEIENEEDS
ncbi:hypothetical protein LWI29_005682 [Acer saccharum]|uniref:Uncharacterized protein n=1 Tax=Acer saccharum TaxID=4024 RepID=A0AA39RCH9_ACESA|nr:hypothetical protein LWI29_005682 [Acer saccharum]